MSGEGFGEEGILEGESHRMTSDAGVTSGANPNLTVKMIESVRDMKFTHGIQRNVWGYRDASIIPFTQLISIQNNGGLVLGAYLNERLVGFLFGFLGRSGDKLYMFSQRMGVLPQVQSQGIGRQLKLAQREAVLAQGIDLIVWTYDPLEGKNAMLNIERLGGITRTYARDIYGRVDNPLQSGLATDRFLVEWKLNHPHVLERLDAAQTTPSPETWEEAYRLVNYANWGSELPRPIAADLDLNDDVLLVQVPANLQAIRRRDLKVAAGWRNTTRVIFESYFARGYAVTGFASNRDFTTPNIYRLEKTDIPLEVDFSPWLRADHIEEEEIE